MRTTIEITNEQRAKLLQLAAHRGLKGFSPLIQEALDEYLTQSVEKDSLILKALELKGSLDRKDADHLQEVSQAVRRSWRS